MGSTWSMITIISVFCWSTLLLKLGSGDKFDKIDAQIGLLLIFWPIGLPILITAGIVHLCKKAFSKEE